MYTLKFMLCLVTLIAFRPLLEAQDSLKSNAHVGLIYPISTNGTKAPFYTNRFSLHLIAGVSRAETGIALAGFSLLVKDSTAGLQAAGFSNHIGNKARGVMLAGFMNTVKNQQEGVQAAGLLNLDGSSKGLALAGFGNICRDSSGVQVAGLINKSGDVRFQAAGLINVAKKVKGAQLAGLINIADSSEYPIGFLNIIRNGEQSIGVSTDETMTTLVTFRSGSRKLYGILGLGYNGKNGQDLYAWEAGLGAHFWLTSGFLINTELAATGLSDLKHGMSYRQSLRILPALRLGRHVEFFAGPTFNHADFKKEEGGGLITHYVWSQRQPDGRLQGLYLGATGGLNIIL